MIVWVDSEASEAALSFWPVILFEICCPIALLVRISKFALVCSQALFKVQAEQKKNFSFQCSGSSTTFSMTHWISLQISAWGWSRGGSRFYLNGPFANSNGVQMNIYSHSELVSKPSFSHARTLKFLPAWGPLGQPEADWTQVLSGTVTEAKLSTGRYWGERPPGAGLFCDSSIRWA
jgi:hypothetical protein